MLYYKQAQNSSTQTAFIGLYRTKARQNTWSQLFWSQWAYGTVSMLGDTRQKCQGPQVLHSLPLIELNIWYKSSTIIFALRSKTVVLIISVKGRLWALKFALRRMTLIRTEAREIQVQGHCEKSWRFCWWTRRLDQFEVYRQIW